MRAQRSESRGQWGEEEAEHWPSTEESVGRVSMRARRRDTGTGKREEPTGIHDTELLVPYGQISNFRCVS